MNDYGHFDDARSEYVITRHFPPAAWMNFLLNDRFTAIVSQSAGGSCFYDAAATGRLTAYRQEHAVPTDRPGFYLYVREADGTLWAPTYEPVRTEVDRWSCRHGLGYTTFEAEYKGLEATITFFVPPDDTVLVWEIEFRNNRKTAAKFSTTSFVQFSFLHAARELEYWHWCRFYTDCRYDPSVQAIKFDYRVFEDLPKLKVFTACSETPAGFDCDQASFIGRGGTLDAPAGVKAGKLANSAMPGGGHGVGALQCEHELAPGASKRFSVTVGCAPTWKEADALIGKFQSLATVSAELDRVRTTWRERVGVFQCELPDKDIQRMLNAWNPYNCVINVNRKKSMTASVTGMERTGIQTRDTMQDAMSLLSLRPALARKLIDYIISFQYPSGEYPATIDPTLHKPAWYYAVRSDNGVWPVYTAHAYVSESGNVAWLREKIRFYTEKGPSDEGTVLEHLWRGLKHIDSLRGRNGLPLIIDIDWNDNLYIFKVDGKEESVMLGQQLVYAAQLLKELAMRVGGVADVIAWCDEAIARLTAALNSPAVWDGAWYRRYLFSNDDKPHLGSAKRREGSIYLNTQSWAVISETGPGGRAQQSMDAAHANLSTPHGLRLLNPPYTGIPEPEDPLYNNGPGVRENGGVFHHAHAWAAMAETILRHGDLAHKLYRDVLPNVASDQRGADKYVNEPYAFSSTTLASPHPRAGEGDLAWFTGTVTWMYVIGTQYLLGIRPCLTGLLIDPCVPSTWKSFRITRQFRGATLNIHITNPDGVQTGVKSVRVDGKPISGNVLSAFVEGETHDVEVTMGAPA